MKKRISSSMFVAFLISVVVSGCIYPTPPGNDGTPTPRTSVPRDRPITTPSPFPLLPADVIYYNGNIITMNDQQPKAQAIAIAGERIVAVGTNEEVLAHKSSSTQVIDLEGKTVAPGFIDSHQHRIGDRWKRDYIEADPVIQLAIEQGWTTIDELFVDQDRLNELIALDREGRLRLRVNAYLPVNDNNSEGGLKDHYYENYSQGQMVSPHVRVAGLKIFTDYDNANILFWKQEDLNPFLLNLHQEGWQLAVKTVGTRSLEMILEAFEYIETIDPNVVNSRGRLEHVPFLTSEQIARVKHLGLIASIQTNMPGELVGSQDLAALMAHETQDSAFPFRSLIQANITIANGSAWPTFYVDELAGAPFGSPIRLIYQAVTREGNLGTQPEAWMLDQAISAEDAMHGLTINAAYANFQDDILGSLAVGKLADLVILSDTPLLVGTTDINNIEVWMTMIGGKVEYCAAGFEALCLEVVTTLPVPVSNTETPSTMPLFSGVWEGTDPVDGSITTISLTQTGTNLTGTFKDTFSPNVAPPGYEGNGSGVVLSDTTAQITFDLSRWDGKTVQWQLFLTLSDQNNTLTLDCEAGCPIVMHRK